MEWRIAPHMEPNSLVRCGVRRREDVATAAEVTNRGESGGLGPRIVASHWFLVPRRRGWWVARPVARGTGRTRMCVVSSPGAAVSVNWWQRADAPNKHKCLSRRGGCAGPFVRG
ncbi:hypothetical protein TRVL_09623 [Trypanosoma vivax]|uniref:Uncharacterized protein n=1 Tax=Trypanosoma vivax (strain Y486) TaxID=1055687 RepID=G0U0Y3_TRYVY|nr:hypothetical protein TRVL_09623 [Trypanosoma vivax]CCC49738.1 hypothetical protein TVY486_0803460 [Trypanosoma vivax Y486]